MNDGFHGLIPHQGDELWGVVQVDLAEDSGGNAFRIAAREVVHNNDIVPLFLQEIAGVGANVACSTGY